MPALEGLVDVVVGPRKAMRPAGPSLDAVAECARSHLEAVLAGIPPGDAGQTLSAMGREADRLLPARVPHLLLLLDTAAPLGFNAIARSLAPISTRTLARKLAFLRAKGLVRRSLVDNPPRVEYRLTDAGHRLAELLFPAVAFVGGRASAPPPPAPPA